MANRRKARTGGSQVIEVPAAEVLRPNGESPTRTRIVFAPVPARSAAPTPDRVEQLITEVEGVRNAMAVNIADTLHTHERVQETVERAAELEGATNVFTRRGRRVKKTMLLKNIKIIAGIVVVVTVVVLVIAAVITVAVLVA
jgi:ribosomal protein L17